MTISEWVSSISANTVTNWAMIYNIAHCIYTAWTRAGIGTPIANACLITLAILINCTFRVTVWRWTVVVWKAWARGHFTVGNTLWVWSTWRRNTWINIYGDILGWSYCFEWIRLNKSVTPTLVILLKLTRYLCANRERISGITRQTSANGTVVMNSTFSICTTSSWARINTFLIETSFVKRTFGTNNALRSAGRGRTNISRQTRTYCLPIKFTALAIGTTRSRLAGIYIFQLRFWIKL